MSSETTYFIEYKKSNEKDWKLYSPMIPAEKLENSSESSEYFFNKLYTCTLSIEGGIQGYPRDVLDGDNNFNKRGFPIDMSRTLKEYLDYLENEYQVKYHTSLGWGESYATVEELISFADKKLSELETQTALLKSKYEHNDILEEIRHLETLILKNDDIPQADTDIEVFELDESDDYYDMILEYQDEVSMLEGFIEFCNSIVRMVNFWTHYWYCDSEVRLIFFTS